MRFFFPLPPAPPALRRWPDGPRGWRIHTAAWLVLVMLAMAWDHSAYLFISVKTPEALLALDGKDWYRALRVMGFFGTWLAVGSAMILVDRRRAAEGEPVPGGAIRRAVLLWMSAAISALAAEGLKIVFGRMRPEDTGGWYDFMPLDRRLFEASDLGLPSSHAAAAFGAAFALSLMFRPAAPVFLLAAAGCGFTRVLSGAHFVSDAVAAAWVAYAVTVAIWRLDAANNAGVGLGEPAAPAREPRPTLSAAPAPDHDHEPAHGSITSA